jgi:hypothetical protein
MISAETIIVTAFSCGQYGAEDKSDHYADAKS